MAEKGVRCQACGAWMKVDDTGYPVEDHPGFPAFCEGCTPLEWRVPDKFEAKAE